MTTAPDGELAPAVVDHALDHVNLLKHELDQMRGRLSDGCIADATPLTDGLRSIDHLLDRLATIIVTGVVSAQLII
jgi:hypothetical protein